MIHLRKGSKEQSKQTIPNLRKRTRQAHRLSLQSAPANVQNFTEFEKRFKSVLLGSNLELSTFSDLSSGIKNNLSSKSNKLNEDNEIEIDILTDIQITSTPKRKCEDNPNGSKKCCRYLKFDFVDEIFVDETLSQGYYVNFTRVISIFPIPIQFTLDFDKNYYISSSPVIFPLTFRSEYPSPCNPDRFPMKAQNLFCTTLSKPKVPNVVFSIRRSSSATLCYNTLLQEYFKNFLWICFNVKCSSDFILLNYYRNDKTIVRRKVMQASGNFGLKNHTHIKNFKISNISSFQESFKHFIIENPTKSVESVENDIIEESLHNQNLGIQDLTRTSKSSITLISQIMSKSAATDEKCSKYLSLRSFLNNNLKNNTMHPFTQSNAANADIAEDSEPLNLSTTTKCRPYINMAPNPGFQFKKIEDKKYPINPDPAKSILPQSVKPYLFLKHATENSQRAKLTTSNLDFVTNHLNKEPLSDVPLEFKCSRYPQQNFELSNLVAKDVTSSVLLKKTHVQNGNFRPINVSQNISLLANNKNSVIRNPKTYKISNTQHFQRTTSFSYRSQSILDGIRKALSEPPKSSIPANDNKLTIESKYESSPEKVNSFGYVEVTFCQDIIRQYRNSKLVVYVPQNITIKSKINTVRPNAILTGIISNDTGIERNFVGLLHLRKILSIEELNAFHESFNETIITKTQSNVVFQKQLFMFQSYKSSAKNEQNFSERLKRTNDTYLRSGTYLLIPARKSSDFEGESFVKRMKSSENIEDFKKDIGERYNIGDDFLSIEELLKIPDEEFLCSNVSISDIF